MKAKRPYDPPTLAGFEFVKLLGQGGFADVFEYRQLSPRRRVALKVLLPNPAGGSAAETLEREANAMVDLSQHPNIVTVLDIGTAPDGRPYLSMDLYEDNSIATGWRTVQLSLDKALSMAVQLAGALESAHRNNIIHRDIKPQNILKDRAGRPVLGDFGIAMDAEEASRRAEGLSIPWSPPESFAENPTPSRVSDVYSLAATLYSLLAKRAPFEVPGGDNRPHAQADRIVNSPYRPLGRSDAPASLDQVLRTAMSKNAAARYQSMEAFGNALRGIQEELHLTLTTMEIFASDYGYASSFTPDDNAAPGTNLRAPQVIDPGLGAVAALRDSEGGRAGAVPSAWSSDSASSWSGAAKAADPWGSTSAPEGVSTSKSASATQGGAATQNATANSGAAAGILGQSTSWVSGEQMDRTLTRPVENASPVPIFEPEPTLRKRFTAPVVVGIVVVALALLIGIYVLVMNASPNRVEKQVTTPGVAKNQPAVDPISELPPPAPNGLQGKLKDGKVVFSWKPVPAENLAPKPYCFKQMNTKFQPTGASGCISETQLELTADSAEQACIEVVTVKKSGRESENPTRECAK